MAIQKLKGEKITIDKLAEIINKGFNEQTKHFNKVLDEKFDKVEKDMGEMKKDIKQIKTQLTDVVHEPKFEKLETRVDYLENIMAVKKN